VTRFRRGEVARYAAPAAFLLAVTVAVLLVRAGLEGGGGDTTPSLPSAPVTTASTTKPKPKPPTTTRAATTTAAAQYYTVQSGDTFGSIAAKEGTSVQQLETLNPNVDPAALRVGQQIRVK
jgi:LysM repeat protein